ncbi:hypothetical protein BT93_B1917 [Corymbia citriodora subsp. variegata]|nr:hypothetical protein BT93_B1917 [Corymbia citriodora subsp. variegata]
MGSLWISLDHVNRGTGSSKPSLRFRLPGMGWWNHLPSHRSARDLLLLQPHIACPGVPRPEGQSTSTVQRHGSRHHGAKMGEVLRRSYPVHGLLWRCCWLHSSGRRMPQGDLLAVKVRWDDEALRVHHNIRVLMLVLAQIPSFHSLRHINMVSLILSLLYSACATGCSIYIGLSSKGPEKDYSLVGDTTSRIFGVFNAIAIIATTYGNGIIPEIQATLAPPVTGKMFKGLCVCYTVVVVTFFSVAISGYWAFSNQAEGLLLSNFLLHGKALLPKWFILMTNMFTILQLSAVGVVYLQPTNEVLEKTFADPTSGEFSARNVIPRLISRSISVFLATTIAAMLPFFGDINSLIGAFGFLPLDFVLPVVFYNLTFKPSRRSPIFWLNITIAVVFSTVAVIAAVAAVRQIVLDADMYQLFANV